MATTSPTPAVQQTSAAKPQPAPQAKGETKPDNLSGCTDVPCKPSRKVAYVLRTAGDLSIPYAVSINGKVDPAFAKKPKLWRANSQKIELTVLEGDTVALYLNSDAHPDRRSVPVYRVTAKLRDVTVKIEEKYGKHDDADTPVLQPTKPVAVGATPSNMPEVDEYLAPLTGDIWMKISHKYSEAEAQALIPADVSAEVAEAVKHLYGNLRTSQITIDLPAKAQSSAKKLKVEFPHQSNPSNNITQFSLLIDGVPRAHPAGYAVLFQAALDNDIDKITMNSCWRPLLGSIKHRAGLGLDVGYLGDIRLNRQEMIGAANTNDDDNVSVKERELFAAYTESKSKAEAAAGAAGTAARAFADSTKVLSAAKAKFKAAKTEEQRSAAQVEVDKASKLQQEAEGERNRTKDLSDESNANMSKAKEAWTEEKNAREPIKVKAYRASLLRCACVAQLFDPWYIDVDTHDKVAPLHNEQRGDSDSLERLHSHHLHITIDDPKLL